MLDVVTDLLRQDSPSALLERLVERVRTSVAADFAAVLEVGEFRMVAGEGELPDRQGLEALARPALSEAPRPAAVDSGVATACMAHAQLVVVVGRDEPVLRDRERQWVSIMADIADLGWSDLA